MAPPPPTPFSIGRFHSCQVNALYVSLDNERVYSGDSEGRVVCTLTRTFRALVSWRAHKEGLLTIAEWENRIITHGRDNKLRVWAQIASLPTLSDTATVASSSSPTSPTLLYSLDVNALNFCRFSLIVLPPVLRRTGTEEAFIAVPNLVESGYTDVWALPSLDRIHAAIGKQHSQSQSEAAGKPPLPDGRGEGSGIIMAQHLYYYPIPEMPKPQLRLLCAYEAGHVTLFARTDAFLDRSIEGKTWDALWSVKAHVESVMGMTVSPDQSFALTVSADHLIGKFLLADTVPQGSERMTVHKTKYPGNATVVLRDDGRVCAVGGWDGIVRLYSSKSFKSLGTLAYHAESIYALAFAHRPSSLPSSDLHNAEGEEDDDGWEPKDSERRSRWLVSAGEEGRVAFWELTSFER